MWIKNILLVFTPLRLEFFLHIASKKTLNFLSGFLEDVKDKASEVLKIREFAFVNDRFQNEGNAVFGVLLETLHR